MKKYILIAFLGIFLLGCGNETVDIEGEAVTYDDLQEKIKTAEEKLESLEKDLESVEKQINDNRDELGETTEENKQKKSTAAEVEVKDEDPIEVGAGHFVFGEDVPTGRYEAFPIGNSSKITVVDLLDDTRVNTVIGTDDSPSFVFTALHGYKLELSGAVELVPLEIK